MLEATASNTTRRVIWPEYVHLTRGNHEEKKTNARYGFLAEVKVFETFFKQLPVAHVINRQVFVVRGGLPLDPHARLADIQGCHRPSFKVMEARRGLSWKPGGACVGRFFFF